MSCEGYWQHVRLEAEIQKPTEHKVADLGEKFPDIITTLCPNAWYKSQARVDAGWGCGYRNVQTILSALMQVPEFANLLPDFVPSVASIQLLIEEAWRDGFDSVGADQLVWKLCGTKKWIGATEVATLLGFLGIKCKVVDFGTPTGRTPTGRPTHKALVDWINTYITNNISFPVYLQFAGHSQTVVGCRTPSKGLFILDPKTAKSAVEPSYLPTQATNHAQYQLVAITGVHTRQSRESLKATFIHEKVT